MYSYTIEKVVLISIRNSVQKYFLVAVVLNTRLSNNLL